MSDRTEARETETSHNEEGERVCRELRRQLADAKAAVAQARDDLALRLSPEGRSFKSDA